MCKVLKQKIWVEGVSYELQEIYGMEHASDGRARTQVCCYDRSCVSLSLSLCACVCVCALYGNDAVSGRVEQSWWV